MSSSVNSSLTDKLFYIWEERGAFESRVENETAFTCLQTMPQTGKHFFRTAHLWSEDLQTAGLFESTE